jgi:hypothetical protein
VTVPGDGKLNTKSAVRIDITLAWNTALNTTPHTRVMSLIVTPNGMLGINK